MTWRALSVPYRSTCLTALRAFARSGERVVALCPFLDSQAACALCGTAPIWRCVPLCNEATGAVLALGSECVHTYHDLVRQLRRAVNISTTRERSRALCRGFSRGVISPQRSRSNCWPAAAWSPRGCIVVSNPRRNGVLRDAHDPPQPALFVQCIPHVQEVTDVHD